MTPDEAAFLKAITDNPADETARLVYADWLSDHDDPRAAFARLSADFLRCVRSLAEFRQTLPTEWRDAMDPLFNRFNIVRMPALGEAFETGIITQFCVGLGSSVTIGQPILEIVTDKASMELPAEHAGAIISFLVRRGDRVAIGQPLLAYLAIPVTEPVPPLVPEPVPPSPIVSAQPQIPSAPLSAFIHLLESRRESLRSLPIERIDEMMARHTVAATMVFGSGAVEQARRVAEMNLNWSMHATRATKIETLTQIRLDIHIEMFRVLLRRHGQPDGFAELPDIPTE